MTPVDEQATVFVVEAELVCCEFHAGETLRLRTNLAMSAQPGQWAHVQQQCLDAMSAEPDEWYEGEWSYELPCAQATPLPVRWSAWRCTV